MFHKRKRRSPAFDPQAHGQRAQEKMTVLNHHQGNEIRRSSRKSTSSARRRLTARAGGRPRVMLPCNAPRSVICILLLVTIKVRITSLYFFGPSTSMHIKFCIGRRSLRRSLECVSGAWLDACRADDRMRLSSAIYIHESAIFQLHHLTEY